jgi:hypothetical protein
MIYRGRRGRMVFGFTTICAISVYQHHSCEFEPRLWRSVHSIQHYVIKLRQVGGFLDPDTPVSSTNKTDRHNIAEILLKVALKTINLNKTKLSS